jgi:serine/threonine-protein kinase
MPHNVKGRVRWDDPAHAAPGMVRVQLDPAGRLQRYACRPDGRQRRGAPPSDAEVFALAGLDFSAFTATAPALVPDAYADERAAWQTADGSARVELARLSGFPVQFEHFAVSAPPHSEDVRAPSVRFAARVVLLLIAGALAWQAVTRRQADGAGAARIGLTMLLLVAMFTVLTGDHGGSWGGVGSLTLEGLSHGLAVACELVLYYLALEPHARRIWPRTMTSWSRLLAGRWRDPQVAAAVVAGAFAGTVTALLHHELPLVQRAYGVAECSPVVGLDHDLESLAGLGPALGVFCEIVVDVMRQGMMTFVALVALRLLLRRQGLVLIAAVALWTASREYGDVGPAWIEAVSAATTIVSATLVVVVAIRFGLLALIVGALVHALALSFPMRPDLSVWYSTITLLPAVALVLLLLAAVFLPRERRLLAA